MRSLVATALRNFLRHLRRYRVLAAALLIITLALTMVLSVVLGLRESLHEKASRYFAGDAVVVGFAGGGGSLIEDSETVRDAIRRLEAHGEVELLSRAERSTYYESQSIELFFSGYWTKQRRLVGVQWDLERSVLENLHFVAGGVPEAGDRRGGLISTATADLLHIGVGDELLVSIRSDRGRTNTVELIVRGIYAESSFFGYTTYLQRRTLNELREAPEDRVNEIGVYVADPIRHEDEAAQFLVAQLSKELPSFGVLDTRSAYEKASGEKVDKRHYGVVTVGAQLAEINDIIGAITIIAGLIMLMFLAIVVVGVANTFTMVVWERTREIGTLRALGMQKGRAVISFLIEAGLLGLSAAAAGLLLGLLALEAVRKLVEFPPNFVTTLFLTQGRLQWILPAWGVALVLALVVGSCLFGSLRAALRAGKMRPVEALSRHK